MSDTQQKFGSADLRLPDELREPLKTHLAQLKERYLSRGWAGRAGFGDRPAVLVIDLAEFWLQPTAQIGSDLTSVVDATCRVLAAARATHTPIFFTSYAYDPAHPASPHDRKLHYKLPNDVGSMFQLDPRLGRRDNEKIVLKRFASAFKGTCLHEMLTGLGIDTLIVTGVSTSHCVYASCRDATDSFRVIVPREAVGERCELMHEAFLFDIDVDLADVTPLADVVSYLEKPRASSSPASGSISGRC